MIKAIHPALLAVLGIFATATPSLGQGSPPQRQQQRPPITQRRPQPQNFLAEFRAATDSLGKAFEVKIVVDPAIWVPGKPKAPEAETIAASLDQLVSQARKASWKKVYLKGVQGVTIPPEKLAESLRALDAVEQNGIFPAAAAPAATEIMFCSAMRHSRNCSGNFFANHSAWVEFFTSASRPTMRLSAAPSATSAAP